MKQEIKTAISNLERTVKNALNQSREEKYWREKGFTWLPGNFEGHTVVISRYVERLKKELERK